MQRLTLGVLIAVAVLLGGCSPRHLIIQGIGNELASQGSTDEDDLGLAREASAFYLKLSESILRESPGNLKLAQAVSGGFTQYAYAFVAFEAERVESKDASPERTRQAPVPAGTPPCDGSSGGIQSRVFGGVGQARGPALADAE